MTLKEILDKLIIVNNKGTYTVDGNLVTARFPAGYEQLKDADGHLYNDLTRSLYGSLAFNVMSESFPQSFEQREGMVTQEDKLMINEWKRLRDVEPEPFNPIVIPPVTVEPPLVDVRGVVFDPALHIVNNDGTPRMAKGLYFCKKAVVADVTTA